MRVLILSMVFVLAAQAGGLNLYSIEKEIALGRQLAHGQHGQARLAR